MKASMVALLIPTINRSEFLIRQLNYYKDTGFQGQICIVDSSSTGHVEATRRAIEGFHRALTINYLEYPGLSDSQAIKRLCEIAVRPYAAFVADDDFLIPEAMEQCAGFLDEHSDYNSAHGKALTISLKSRGAYGQIAGARPYPQPVTEAESATQRIQEHLGSYEVTLFSVHRSESWRRMYRNISSLSDRTFAGELLPCCLSVIQGKVKALDCLYLVRQDHPQRYLLPGKDRWVKNPGWPTQYRIFCDLLAAELADKDAISLDRAEEVIERAFDSYMVNLLGEKWRTYCGKGDSSVLERLRRVARFIPGARLVWNALHFSKPEQHVEIQVPELMDPSSAYQAAFAPVYAAVTGGKAGVSGQMA